MRDASSLIQQQYRDGGVIPGQLVGQDAVSKDYVDGLIDQVEQKADKAQSDISNHVNSTEAHISQNITYSGSVAGASNVKQGLDNLNGRVDNIVAQAGNDNTEIVDARGEHSVLGGRLDEIDSKIEMVDKKFSMAILNSLQLSKFYKKMQNAVTAPIGNAVTITCIGDSITAGNGATTGSDYPSQLKNYLEIIARPGQVITMINRGIGGDTAKTSFENWTTPSGGDVCVIMLGTNDYNKNISMDEFSSYYQKIIEREIEGGTGVVLSTPHKWRSSDWLTKENNGSLSDYAAVIKNFGKVYNAPVIDLLAETKNLPINAYKAGEADPGIHFSDSGYKLIAHKLAAVLGFNHPDTLPRVQNNSFLNVRNAIDGIKFPSSYTTTHHSKSYPGAIESVANEGTGFIANDPEKVFHYAFYVAEDNLAIIPSIFFTSTNGEEIFDMTICDNNMLYQPENLYQYSETLNRTLPTGILTLRMSDFTEQANITTTQNLFVNPQTAKYLYFPIRGWYTVQVKCKHCRFHGFDFMNVNHLEIYKQLSIV